MDDSTDAGFAQQYANSIKKLFMLTVFAAILIIIFMISPVSNLLVASSLGKVLIIALLVYIISINVWQTGLYQQAYNINVRDFTFSQGELTATYGHIFTYSLIILLYYVAKNLISPLFGDQSQSQLEPEMSSSFNYNK